MIGKISEKAARALCEAINNEENYELYQYAIFIVLSAVLHFTSVIILGICFDLLVESLLFYISFIAIRKFAGGYHSKTPTRCFLYSLTINFSVLLAIKLLSAYNGWITFTLCVFSFLIILLFSPVGNANKPLNDKEKKIYRWVAITITFVLLVVFLLLKYFFLSSFANAVCLGIFTSAVVVIAGKIFNFKTQK